MKREASSLLGSLEASRQSCASLVKQEAWAHLVVSLVMRLDGSLLSCARPLLY